MNRQPEIEALEHIAGAFSLELVNSATGIARAGFDWLNDPASARAWARSLNLRLGSASAAEICELRETRETIHRVFRAVADGADVPDTDIDALASVQAAGLERWSLRQCSTGFARAWPQADTPVSLGARAADDAFELLRHARLDRIRACERCGWLYLDVSRNGRRRWCSMRSCGAKVKAQRHYERQRGASSTA